ncbi:TRAP transporter substrate-binding protein [Variovorax sp.]|jgi:tripartite ATP-independent transporter DctP family solute receptor|uniref:TRAP transporter substrate-binding protein n=1 Tax=unclassified Variovorax TaxID=663243 RepID=UPI0037D9B4BC
MSSMTRRTLLIGGAATAGATLVSLPAQAAPEFTCKFANNLPLAHPLNVRANEAAARIKADTGGRVELQVFPNGQLGSDTDMLSQVRSGAIEFMTLSGLILATLVPAASISGLGFAFPNYDAVWSAMDGSLGTYVRGQIAKSNLVAMDKIWDSGFRQITTSTRPIDKPADLKGLKIRLASAPIFISLFKSLDAATTPINFNELYSALQTKIVDAQENPLSILSTAKFYEVQKFCSITNHAWDGFWFLANRRAWERLPESLRPIVAKHINEAAMAERADLAQLNNSVRADLAGKGLKFNEPDVAPFREALRGAGFYETWKKNFGEEAWAALEKSTGKLS